MIWWLGTDVRGRELEIVGFDGFDTRNGERVLLIIHVMPTSVRNRGGKR